MLRWSVINFRAHCGDLWAGEFLGVFFTDRKAAVNVNLFHVEQIPKSGSPAAAGFEFFSAAAGAGVVAADFGKLAFQREFELRRGRLVGGGGGDCAGFRGFRIEIQLRSGEESRELGEEGFEGLEIRCAPEEIVQNLALNGVHQIDEHGVGVVFVFDERILLAEGAEVDGFAETIHRIEVFLPEAIDGIENDVAFEAFEGFGVLECRLALVGIGDGFHEEL